MFNVIQEAAIIINHVFTLCPLYSTFYSNTVYRISRQSLRQANTNLYLVYADGKDAEIEEKSTHLGKIKLLSWTVTCKKQPQQQTSDSNSS